MEKNGGNNYSTDSLGHLHSLKLILKLSNQEYSTSVSMDLVSEVTYWNGVLVWKAYCVTSQIKYSQDIFCLVNSLTALSQSSLH